MKSDMLYHIQGENYTLSFLEKGKNNGQGTTLASI